MREAMMLSLHLMTGQEIVMGKAFPLSVFKVFQLLQPKKRF